MSLTYRVYPCQDIKGRLKPPGDKSLSHRCVLFGGLATGTSNFTNVLHGEDVLSTMEIMRQLGVRVTSNQATGEVQITSPGLGLFDDPQTILDCGNSGTCARLMMGLLASHPLQATLSGDVSLNGRPMQRVIEPLSLMGAECQARDDRYLPMYIRGRDDLIPIQYTLPVASAQVKSAILIAALNTRGVTEVVEPYLCRDHTERLLPLFGAKLEVRTTKDHHRAIACDGQFELKAADFSVPGDISSAAFPLAAALLVPDGNLIIENVGLNPTRNGFLQCLEAMKATIKITEHDGHEPHGTVSVQSSELVGGKINANPATLIDEYPILSVVAAAANGETLFENIGELRFKESDRIASMIKALRACGVTCEDGPDWMRIHGNRQAIQGDVTLDAEHDHRLAMSFIVLGLISKKPVTVTGAETIATSYPSFVEDMRQLGAQIEEITADTAI